MSEDAPALNRRIPVVLVTGCSSGGIGYSLCEEFASQGCRVFASARRLDAMAGLQELGIETLELDVTSESSVQSAVNAVVAGAGRIDVLVNNAGAGCVGPLGEIPLARVQANFDTNVFGVLRMVQAVLPHMTKQRSGRIVNIGSIVGWIVTPWGGTYCATKAAVHSLTHTLRLELQPYGIKVMLVAPGAIRSNIANNISSALSLEYLSIFLPFKASIEKRASISQGSNSMPTDKFAKEVVKRALQDEPPREYSAGGMSSLFYFLRWLPLWLVDFIFARRFGLNVLLPRGEEESKSD